MSGGHKHHPALRRYLVDIIESLRSGPKTFLELRRDLGRPPAVTLSQTLRELRSCRLVEPFTHRVGDRTWKKYRLTPKGAALLPEIRKFATQAEELERKIRG